MCQKYDGMALITIPLIANQALGALSTSFSWLERDARRRGAFSLYWDSNAFALFETLSSLIRKTHSSINLLMIL